jgi:hypothetical protein
MEKSWVWEISYKDDKATILLCETPTRYEALSGVVGWLFNRCIPGTFGICNRLIEWLDTKVTTKYEIEISKGTIKYLDDYFEESDGEEKTEKRNQAEVN